MKKLFKILSVLIVLATTIMVTGCAKDAGGSASGDIYGKWDFSLTTAELADETLLAKIMTNEYEADIVTMGMLALVGGVTEPWLSLEFTEKAVTMYMFGEPDENGAASYEQDGNVWIVTMDGAPMNFTVNGNKMVCDMYPDFVFKRK